MPESLADDGAHRDAAPATDRTGGALHSLRQLYATGTLVIVSPPTDDPELVLEAKTVIQLDGDVLTLIHPDRLDAGLDAHFQRVRRQLGALHRLRRRILAVLSIPPLGIGLWQGGEALMALLDPLERGWQVLWQHGLWVLLAGLVGALVPRAAGWGLRRLLMRR